MRRNVCVLLQLTTHTPYASSIPVPDDGRGYGGNGDGGQSTLACAEYNLLAARRENTELGIFSLTTNVWVRRGLPPI